jgi:hypothetical protein
MVALLYKIGHGLTQMTRIVIVYLLMRHVRVVCPENVGRYSKIGLQIFIRRGAA